MKTFRSKWNYNRVEDGGCYMSKSATSFVTGFRNMLKRELTPHDINVCSFTAGHYFCSGFVEKDGKYVYISYDIPRYGEKIDFSQQGVNGVLYRTAKSERDFHGGPNNFCSIEQLPKAIVDLFDNYDWYVGD